MDKLKWDLLQVNIQTNMKNKTVQNKPIPPTTPPKKSTQKANQSTPNFKTDRKEDHFALVSWS